MNAQDNVIEWLKSTGPLLAEAQDIVYGDEFDYADDELAEYVMSWLFEDIDDERLSTSLEVDLRERDTMAAQIDRVEFDKINWEEVRNAILPA